MRQVEFGISRDDRRLFLAVDVEIELPRAAVEVDARRDVVLMRRNRDIVAVSRNRDIVGMAWNANAVRVIVDLVRVRRVNVRARPYKGLIFRNTSPRVLLSAV